MSLFVNEVYNPFLRHNVPAPFKPANRKPVKGGRWKIRKTRNRQRPWRAWTEGAASIYRANFATHAGAVKYANGVATLFALHYRNPDRRHELIREFYLEMKRRETLTQTTASP